MDTAPHFVQVSVHALPEQTAVTLDDQPIANPSDQRIPNDHQRHVFVFRADGYKTTVDSRTLDRDVSLNVMLEKDDAPVARPTYIYPTSAKKADAAPQAATLATSAATPAVTVAAGAAPSASAPHGRKFRTDL